MPENLRALIVDDSEHYRKWASRDLKFTLMDHQNLGYKWTEDGMYEAGTSEEGLEILKKENPHLVILDINLNPDDRCNQDGIDKFLIPARGGGCKTPIICWSRDKEYRWIARRAGADEFVQKLGYDEFNYDLQNAAIFLLEREKG